MERWVRMAKRLTSEVDGVVGVCLGGSRARGAHAPDSDVDLGLYYRGPLDTGALRRIARDLTGEHVEATEPGGWGPWVDGGAWLTVDGTRVDWIYRDLDRVRRVHEQCEAGRFEVGTQPGHPLGFYSPTYVGELVLGRVLSDPDGELGGLRSVASRYPAALSAALVDNMRWEAPFILGGARKGAARGDGFYVAGCLFRAVGLLVQGLHAGSGTWVLNEKGAVRSAGELPLAPPHFAARAHAVFASLGTTADTLDPALDEADRLTAEACRALGV
ncbi:nucleotidyltransferase domain-containing protein [Streptomyces sp. NPDC049954]|uniref:nucleotidyltransferase domain-containing protein n=1 Tax=Streptomyces sp. NPDC049954 TaxID=3155779 RepID=UPI00343B9BB4